MNKGLFRVSFAVITAFSFMTFSMPAAQAAQPAKQVLVNPGLSTIQKTIKAVFNPVKWVVNVKSIDKQKNVTWVLSVGKGKTNMKISLKNNKVTLDTKLVNAVKTVRTQLAARLGLAFDKTYIKDFAVAGANVSVQAYASGLTFSFKYSSANKTLKLESVISDKTKTNILASAKNELIAAFKKSSHKAPKSIELASFAVDKKDGSIQFVFTADGKNVRVDVDKNTGKAQAIVGVPPAPKTVTVAPIAAEPLVEEKPSQSTLDLITSKQTVEASSKNSKMTAVPVMADEKPKNTVPVS